MKRIVCLLVLLSLILITPITISHQAQAAIYAYDELNRLIRVEHDDGTVIEYTYDAAGSRTRQVVTVPNRPPVADAGPDQSVDEDASVTLNGSGSSDPDGDTLTFAWAQTAGPTVTLSSTTVAQPTFTAPNVNANTVLTFRLIVNDGTVDSAPVEVSITVKNKPSGGNVFCFIATAAFGTPMAKEVQILRAFRDTYLMTNELGRAFVSLYYRYSPPIADFIRDRDTLRNVVRLSLLPVIAASSFWLEGTTGQKWFVVVVFTLLSLSTTVVTRRRLRVSFSGTPSATTYTKGGFTE